MKIALSFIVAILGAAWGPGFLAHSHLAVAAPQTVLLCAYIAWTLYWGAPGFVLWWVSTVSPVGGRLLWWPVRIACWLTVLVGGGLCFCVFGGGLVQFLRHCLRH